MGVGSGGGSAVAPWIFIHGTDIVDRGLIVVFFGLSPSGRGLIVLFFGFISDAPPPPLENFLPTLLVPVGTE